MTNSKNRHRKIPAKIVLILYVILLFYIPYNITKSLTPSLSTKIYDSKGFKEKGIPRIITSHILRSPLEQTGYLTWTGAAKDGLKDLAIEIPKPDRTLLSRLLKLPSEPFSFKVCVLNLGTEIEANNIQYIETGAIKFDYDNQRKNINAEEKKCISYTEGAKIKGIQTPEIEGVELKNRGIILDSNNKLSLTITPNFHVTLEPDIWEIMLFAIIITAAVWKIMWDGIYLKLLEIMTHIKT